MKTLSLVVGLVLVLLGVGTYFAQAGDSRSPTALIPCGFGAVFLICALVSTTPARRKHAMHVAATVALLGSGVLGMAGPKLVKAAGGEALARPLATYAQATTGVVCLVFLVAAIRSFVMARKARVAAGEG